MQHTATPTGAAARPLQQATAGAYPGQLRATGALSADAELHFTSGTRPHLFLHLALRPHTGLPYTARVDLGDDTANHMAAEALLPHLRRGATVSVAAQGLELRMDHGHASLRMVQPHSVLILEQPMPPIPTAEA